jgi:hypothetical protein
MNCRKICQRRAATALALTVPLALMLAAPVRAEGPELVQSPPMKYSVEPTVSGMAGEVKPQWLNATGVVGGNQYRLVIYADAAYLDMVVTQSSGAKCSIKRYKAANAVGAPTAPAQSSLVLPVGAESMMMRLAQSPATPYVYLYNEAAIGSCIVWLQAS